MDLVALSADGLDLHFGARWQHYFVDSLHAAKCAGAVAEADVFGVGRVFDGQDDGVRPSHVGHFERNVVADLRLVSAWVMRRPRGDGALLLGCSSLCADLLQVGVAVLWSHEAERPVDLRHLDGRHALEQLHQRLRDRVVGVLAHLGESARHIGVQCGHLLLGSTEELRRFLHRLRLPVATVVELPAAEVFLDAVHDGRVLRHVEKAARVVVADEFATLILCETTQCFSLGFVKRFALVVPINILAVAVHAEVGADSHHSGFESLSQPVVASF